MIRPEIVYLTPNLVPAVRKLHDACSIPYLGGYNPDRTLVATWEGEVVGFVTSWWDKQPIAWVDVLLVHPDYRDRGVAAWLCTTIEALLLEEGAKVIRCVLDEGEAFAAPLEKAGFQRVGKLLVLERHYSYDT